VNEAAPLQETSAPTPRRLSARSRGALVMLSLGVIVTSIVIWLVFHRRDLVESRSVLDFSSYYAAAYALRMNPQANVYDQVVLTSAAQAGVALQPPLPYVYPLPFAYLLIPLAYLPFSTAAFVFFYFNLAIWIGCVLLMAREARHLLGGALRGPEDSPRYPGNLWARLTSDPAPLLALALASATFLACRPLTRAANLGQVTFFVLLPLALIPWLTRRRHEGWVGAMIGVAAILKIIPALLFAYLLVRRRWRALLVGVGVVLVAALACIALVGWDTTYALVPLLFSAGIGQNTLPHNHKTPYLIISRCSDRY
jgi:Glycosyltransferase family 87